MRAVPYKWLKLLIHELKEYLMSKGLFTWTEVAPANRATLGEPTFHTFL